MKFASFFVKYEDQNLIIERLVTFVVIQKVVYSYHMLKIESIQFF